MIRVVPVGLAMMNMWYGHSDQSANDNDYGSGIDVMLVHIVNMIIMVVLILKNKMIGGNGVGMEW